MTNLAYVNLLQGADSNYALSKGATEPIVAMPFGMAHWTPVTNDNWGWQFQPKGEDLLGIRLTHQPSPWMGDYGAFVITPQSGDRRLAIAKRGTPWHVGEADLRPNRMKVALASSGVSLEAAPTERGGVFHFNFPSGASARILIEAVKGETHFELRPDGRTLVGWTRGNSGGVPANFASYIVAELDRPVSSWAIFRGDTAGQEGVAGTGDRLGVTLELRSAAPLTLRVGTSFIGIEQAELNLRHEIGTADLETIALRAEHAWDRVLNQVEIGRHEDEKALRTFYSCLYRTKLFPRQWHEPDAFGRIHHFSPYDGQVHEGVLYADTGFWDTFRTLHPLLTLLDPPREAEMLQGFINGYRESGWLPQWPSPGHRVCMPGTHLDVTIADAYAKGIRGFDLEAAYAGMLRHAEHANVDGPSGAGRPDIENYLRLGYCVGHAAVAHTLDYAYDDWAISTVATDLRHAEVAERLRKRAENWRNVYDPGVGFMRGRNEDGTWLEPWDELSWGGPYVEGGPWQSSWAVQHDPAGLVATMGGDEAFAAKIDRMLSMTSDFHVGSYGQVIHEMTEMKIAPFGQYAHSNQPVHHVLYLYLAAGRPWRCQAEVRRVMDLMYSPDAFSGDEDNGEMAAWYVLSALGIFPLCPGRPEWVLGSPRFRKAKVHLPNGRTLNVDAPENREDRVYVDTVAFDGHLLPGPVVPHATLAGGGVLHFHMSDHPSMRITPVAARPSSMSPYA